MRTHKPSMWRTEYTEDSAKFNLTTTPTRLLTSSTEKRKLLPGSTVSNYSGTDRKATFFLVASGQSAGDTTSFLEDILIKAKGDANRLNIYELPQWPIQPGWELWGEADGNTAVNCVLSFKVQDVT